MKQQTLPRVMFISQEKSLLTGKILSHIEGIKLALSHGVKWIQLRVKSQDIARIEAIAVQAATLCRQHKALLTINDHARIAQKVGADGVHIGLEDMDIKQVRCIVGEQMLIGGTANRIEDIAMWETEGADYVGLGPYRTTQTKEKPAPLLGRQGAQKILDAMKQQGLTIPILILGGVKLDELPFMQSLGAHGIALSNALINKF